MKSEFTTDYVSKLIGAVASVIGKTWRPNLICNSDINPYIETGTGVIYCFWHSRLLALAHIFRNTGKTAIVSSSRDGKRAAYIASCWGHQIIFGSSTRGGVSALRQCTRKLMEGHSVVITPDGPKGPKETVKSGTAQIALTSGAPIVILDIKPNSSWRLNSWDKLIVPKPFTQVTVTASKPIDPADFRNEKKPVDALTHYLQSQFPI